MTVDGLRWVRRIALLVARGDAGVATELEGSAWLWLWGRRDRWDRSERGVWRLLGRHLVGVKLAWERRDALLMLGRIAADTAAPKAGRLLASEAWFLHRIAECRNEQGRLAAWGFYIEGQSMAQIAERLDIDPKQVLALLRGFRSSLRSLPNEEPQDDTP